MARSRSTTASSSRFAFLLTTRTCANVVGVSTEWIRDAITVGVVVDGRRVTLEAEAIPSGTRTEYRIHFDRFLMFLKAIGWRRLPKAADVRPTRHVAA